METTWCIAFCCSKNASFRDGRCLFGGNVGFGENFGWELRETARALTTEGWRCYTPDQLPLEAFDAFLFYDMPSTNDPVWQFALERDLPRYLLVYENPLIDSANAEYGRYRDFTEAFTFEDAAIARLNCHRFNYICDFGARVPKELPFSERKLAVMISSRVKKLRPGLVAYERIRTIDFYERQHPKDFDLYGIGWEKGIRRLMRHPHLYRPFQTLHMARFLPSRACSVWKGKLESKVPTIARYRFSYCYENTICIPGYITEKLFDVLMSGTVPIYLGAPETRRLFPEELYIDRADFCDDGVLYDFISSMTEREWRRYRDTAIDYVNDASEHHRFAAAENIGALVSVIKNSAQVKAT